MKTIPKKKSRLLIYFILIVCFGAIQHAYLHLHAWRYLKPEVQEKWEPYKYDFINNSTTYDGLYFNADNKDAVKDDANYFGAPVEKTGTCKANEPGNIDYCYDNYNHMTLKACEKSYSRWKNKAIEKWNNGDYYGSCMCLSRALHYIQDISSAAHNLYYPGNCIDAVGANATIGNACLSQYSPRTDINSNNPKTARANSPCFNKNITENERPTIDNRHIHAVYEMTQITSEGEKEKIAKNWGFPDNKKLNDFSIFGNDYGESALITAKETLKNKFDGEKVAKPYKDKRYRDYLFYRLNTYINRVYNLGVNADNGMYGVGKETVTMANLKNHLIYDMALAAVAQRMFITYNNQDKFFQINKSM